MRSRSPMFEPSPTYARTTLGTLLCALVLALPAGAARGTPEPQAVRDLSAYPYSIVQLSPHVRPPVGSTPVSRTLHMWRVRGDVARRLLRAGLVVEAAPDVPLVPLGRLEPGDPLLASEWWRSAVGADAAPAPGPGIPVTVVDRGLDGSHPEFASRANTVALNRQRFAREDSEGFHATAVSSVIAAPANGVGLVGAYPQAVLQVWDASPDGVLETSALIRGMDTASARGRTVINLSLGFTGDFFMRTRNVIQQSVYVAVARGSVVVAAGGNGRDFGSPSFYPADMTHVLTVAATDESDRVTGFSSASPTLDLAAPGFRIPTAVPFSFDPSGYSLGTGTSYSAAIVSAATAWVWSARPELRATQIFEVMRRSARDVGPPGFDEDTGFGLLDIPSALSAPAPPPDPLEPNDDISHVATPFWVPKSRPARPLTAPGRAARSPPGSTAGRTRTTSTAFGLRHTASSR